ncbi:MAG TPA: response regulator transcription factor [Bacteroidia bacterium]|nr:response regulator transcription factor [Bacteroidia bacterium]
MNTKKIKVLLADDNILIGTFLKQYLEINNFFVEQVNNGVEAFDLFCKKAYDLYLLDVNMPLMDGITLAKKIRAKNAGIPIIFITANSKEEDILEGFRVGADDYITKPYDTEEILVRINAVLRRTEKKVSTDEHITEFNIGKYVFNSLTQELVSKEDNYKLTTKEAQLLRLLALNKNKLLDRSYTLKTIWNESNHFSRRSMDVYITKLRKYLKNESKVEIVNVHGGGFILYIKP